jgi:hypothetical protein
MPICLVSFAAGPQVGPEVAKQVFEQHVEKLMSCVS